MFDHTFRDSFLGCWGHAHKKKSAVFLSPLHVCAIKKATAAANVTKQWGWKYALEAAGRWKFRFSDNLNVYDFWDGESIMSQIAITQRAAAHGAILLQHQVEFIFFFSRRTETLTRAERRDRIWSQLWQMRMKFLNLAREHMKKLQSRLCRTIVMS